MEEYLLNKAYFFYPQNIFGLDNDYMQQIEIKKLNSHLTTSISNEYELWKMIIDNFNSDGKYRAIDYTNFLLNQPSLHFKIVLENDSRFLKTFNLYSSLVIPFYYFSEKKYDSVEKIFVGKEIINNFDILDNELKNLIRVLDLKFGKTIIPEKYLNLKIPNISFETIQEGDFTVMNAFFNPKDKYYETN